MKHHIKIKSKNVKPTLKHIVITSSILFFLHPNIIKAQCHIDDWTALKALYESTDGDNWSYNTGWQEVLSNAPSANCNLELLHGISLDEQERVETLDFYNNQLNGSIPPELGNLTNLTDLDLRINQLSGSIPSELGNLTNLIDLSLTRNQLSGNIPPELGNLTKLQYFYLTENQFSGSIPPELGSLTKVIRFWLSNNQLSGSIPSELGNLTNVENFRLGGNQLSENIPSELGNLTSVRIIDFSRNQLSGSIPPELGNLINLESLRFSDNQLSGSIPSELSSLSKLYNLNLRDNQLSGNIPDELGNISNLKYLLLANNQLSGNIPAELGSLTKLEYLAINDNNLSGCYPSNISVFCKQLISVAFDGNPDISDGNNFDATWENFCNTGAGKCGLTSVSEMSINLNPGWNLISLDVSPLDKTIQSIFAGLQADNLEMVTGFDNGTRVYSPDLPPNISTLFTLDDGFGYWVKVENADVLIVEGPSLDDDFRKPLNAGWNLIAYPPDASQSPATYFEDLISSGNLELVTGFENGTVTYDPDVPPFANTLQQMKNGFGYWIKVKNAAE